MRNLPILCGQILSQILWMIPESWRWFMVRTWAFFLFDVFRFRRSIVLNNIQIVFPQMPMAERVRLGRESLARLIYNFYEFCLFSRIDEKWIESHIVFKGLDHLDSALQKNQGACLLSLHLGHGDMAISMLANRGYPLNVISKHFKVKWLNDFWFGARKRFGAHFLDPHGRNSSFDILRILKNKGIVIFVLDQYMGPPYGIETTFFGVKTGTAYGLSLFAVKTGSPVLPVWTYRNEAGQNVIELGPEIPVEVREDRDLTLLATTQKYNSILEGLITKFPKDWMWIHRRWKRYRSDLPEESKVVDKTASTLNRGDN